MEDDLYLSTAVELFNDGIWDEETFKRQIWNHANEKKLDVRAVNEFLSRVLKNISIEDKRNFLNALKFDDGNLKYPGVDKMPDKIVEKLYDTEKNVHENEKDVEDVKEDKKYAAELSVDGLINELKKLNEGVDIRSNGDYSIYSSKPVEELVLPEGFYYNDKNGITNKHNTKSGTYIAISVIPIYRATKDALLDRIGSNDEKLEVEEKESEDTYAAELSAGGLIDELKKLNEGVDIRSNGDYSIYSSKPVEELVLPEGFYYNDKNGITNKHNTKSGSYISLLVVPLHEVTKDELLADDSVEEKDADTDSHVDSSEPETEEEYEKIQENIAGAESDSSVREVEASAERINKLKSTKKKVINYFLKGAIVICAVALLNPVNASLAVGGYLILANKIKDGTYNPKGHFGKAVGDVVKKIMNIGMGKEEERGRSK